MNDLISILFSHAEMVESIIYGKGGRKALDANKLGALREYIKVAFPKVNHRTFNVYCRKKLTNVKKDTRDK